jgi:fatty acid kinase fatty acid binding subunit
MSAVAALAVVTDSTHYLPTDLLESAGVEQVSLHVGFGDELRLETDISDLEAFYASLRTSKSMPRTSQPSVGEFTACYEPLLLQGRDVVSVHLAAGLSGTCSSALAASRLLAERGVPGRVEVVDSRSGAAGLGCLVLVAAEAARAGLSVDEVVAKVDRAREGLDMWFCLDTLEYLRRGGRIGGAQAWAGSALRIKPILTFGTEITPVARVRTRRRAFERMVEYLQQLSDRGATDWVVQHIQAPEAAAQLVLRGTQMFGSRPLFCSQVGPVLGAHLGPGMIGVAGLVR